MKINYLILGIFLSLIIINSASAESLYFNPDKINNTFSVYDNIPNNLTQRKEFTFNIENYEEKTFKIINMTPRDNRTRIKSTNPPLQMLIPHGTNTTYLLYVTVEADMKHNATISDVIEVWGEYDGVTKILKNITVDFEVISYLKSDEYIYYMKCIIENNKPMCEYINLDNMTIEINQTIIKIVDNASKTYLLESDVFGEHIRDYLQEQNNNIMTAVSKQLDMTNATLQLLNESVNALELTESYINYITGMSNYKDRIMNVLNQRDTDIWYIISNTYRDENTVRDFAGLTDEEFHYGMIECSRLGLIEQREESFTITEGTTKRVEKKTMLASKSMIQYQDRNTAFWNTVYLMLLGVICLGVSVFIIQRLRKNTSFGL